MSDRVNQHLVQLKDIILVKDIGLTLKVWIDLERSIFYFDGISYYCSISWSGSHHVVHDVKGSQLVHSPYHRYHGICLCIHRTKALRDVQTTS